MIDLSHAMSATGLIIIVLEISWDVGPDIESINIVGKWAILQGALAGIGTFMSKVLFAFEERERERYGKEEIGRDDP